MAPLGITPAFDFSKKKLVKFTTTWQHLIAPLLTFALIGITY